MEIIIGAVILGIILGATFVYFAISAACKDVLRK